MCRPSSLLAVVAAALVALAGCTGGTGEPPATMTSRTVTPSGPVLAWTPVTLPAGLETRTLTTVGDRLLVGALRAGDPPAPAMLTLDAAGGTTAVPVTPMSPYGFEARWYSVATDGSRLIAIGGANGGAHANVRWTTWAGTTAGLTELPQSFYTFGGWGAGDLVEAAVTPTGDALVGSWGGARAGLDAAVWTSVGATWTRQDPAGTALESTAAALAGPRGATADGSGLLIAGSVLRLADGSIRQGAAIWRSSGVNTSWRRLDLPDAGQHSEAVSAQCPPTAERCLVAGQVDGAVAVWDLDGDQATRATGIPALAVGDQDPVPAPLALAGSTLVVSPAASGTVVLSTSATATGPRGWTSSPGPTGRPTAAAVLGDRLYVATREQAGGAVSLWSARWPAAAPG